MTFGEMVKRDRKRARLTQQQLADMVNVSKMTIRRIESISEDIGILSIRFDTICAVADALDSPGLLDYAMDTYGAPPYDPNPEGPPFSEEQQRQIENEGSKRWRLVSAFDILNDTGKTEAVKRVEELTEIPRYTKQEDGQGE